MKKNVFNLEGFQELTNEELLTIDGGNVFKSVGKAVGNAGKAVAKAAVTAAEAVAGVAVNIYENNGKYVY